MVCLLASASQRYARLHCHLRLIIDLQPKGNTGSVLVIRAGFTQCTPMCCDSKGLHVKLRAAQYGLWKLLLVSSECYTPCWMQ